MKRGIKILEDMMIKFKRPLLGFALTALALPFGYASLLAQEEQPPVAAAPAPARVSSEPSPEEKAAMISEQHGKEDVLRQSADAEADACMKKGNEIYQKAVMTKGPEADANYKNAVDLYLEARKNLLNCGATAPYVKEKLKNCESAIARCYYYWSQSVAAQAEERVAAEDYNEAITLCTKAMELYPPCKARMQDLISQYSKMKDTVAYRKKVSESTVDPQKEKRLYDIDVLMRQGKALYEDNQLDQARDKFEEVLSKNPYNEEAIEALRKTNIKMQKIGKLRTDTTTAERNSETEWKMVTPLLPRTLSGESETLHTPVKKPDEVNKIRTKLREIVMDHMEFEDISIETVVKFLKQRSKELDPQKEGVNIFLRLNKPPTIVAPAPAEPGAAPAPDAAPAPPAEEGGKTYNVTMVADNLQLGEVIKYICKSSGLRYRIEKHAIIIASKDVPLEEVETRIYPLEREGVPATTAEEWEAYFKERGVDFPAGAKIIYEQNISRLIATNTPDNLTKLEELIREISVIDPQVLIQAKFVEVTQNDLEELGFEYTVSRLNSNIATIDTNRATYLQAGDTVTFDHDINRYNANGVYQGTTPRGTEYTAAADMFYTKAIPNRGTSFMANDNIVRNVKDSGIGSVTAGSRPDEVFNWTHYDKNGYNVNAVVHALDQVDSSNILSTPRVTTMNGQEATIRMINTVYYPESWNIATVGALGGTIGGVGITYFMSSTPVFSDPTEIGIVLRVTPNVDPDHYTISLTMNPVIQDFLGWEDYSYNINVNGTLYPNTILMPIITARTVETNVSIYDGETIVLGGTIRDTVSVVNDQYPILGDLPLVGRLFQSKASYSAKANLLMFLTCRLVNPDGSPIRERELRGLPGFRN